MFVVRFRNRIYFNFKLNTCKMEALKIDHTKLMTVSNYADKICKTRQTVYNMIKQKEIKAIVIDGVMFIKL